MAVMENVEHGERTAVVSHAEQNTALIVYVVSFRTSERLIRDSAYMCRVEKGISGSAKRGGNFWKDTAGHIIKQEPRGCRPLMLS